MAENIVEFLYKFTDNHYFIIFLLSAFPLIEMKGAIIIAGGMDVNPFWSVVVCWLGSSGISVLLLCLLKPLFGKLKQMKYFKKLVSATETILTQKAEKQNFTVKGKNNYKRYILLLIFVAVPIPLTGVWAGSAIAAFAGMDNFKSCVSIMAGNLIATVIIAAIIYFASSFLNLILVIFLICILLSVFFTLVKLFISAKKTPC